jgi:hypothetical protein
MSGDGRWVAAPLLMSGKKIREALRHLEAKGIVEVRRDNITASQYRIRSADEIDLEHVASFMRRHQPKLIDRVYDAQLARDLAVRRNTQRVYPTGETPPTPPGRPPLPQGVALNSTNLKKGRLVTAPRRAAGPKR